MIEAHLPWTGECIIKSSAVSDLETDLENYFSVLKGFITESGMEALKHSLTAVGVTANDEVIIPTYVCFRVAQAVKELGAKPVFCDCDNYWRMSAGDVAPRITPNTKAIVVVHLFGIKVDVDPFLELGVPIIEDCCHLFWNSWTLKGKAAVFSFRNSKPLTAGGGGAVISNDVTTIEALNNQGIIPTTHSGCAKVSKQIAEYSTLLARRLEIADRYISGLDPSLTVGMVEVRSTSAFSYFMINADAGRAESFLNRNDIRVFRGIHFGLVHKLFDAPGVFNAEKVYNNSFSLPIYPKLTNAKADEVIAACVGL